MTLRATLTSFRHALLAAVEKYAPQAEVILEEKRGIILDGNVSLDRETSVSIYFNALTGKTSYALIRANRRLAGHPYGYQRPTPRETG